MIKKEKGILALDGINSSQILNLLAERHVGDVFIPECKNGETWGARDLLRLDAWCLKRTYSPLTTIGYEIKVSRADFEQDQKWTGYLGLCHEFFFVCPAGLIRATDLPSGIGLMWVSSTGNLHIKKRCIRQEPNIEYQNRLLIYALMARSKIVDNMYDVNRAAPPSRAEELKARIEVAEKNGELATFVNGHIQKQFQAVLEKERTFKHREDVIHEFEERLAKLGITWDSTASDWTGQHTVDAKIEDLKKHISYDTLWSMKAAASSLTKAVEAIESIVSTG